ncbi:MAG: hypothetical protein Q9168_006843 [Polycauliona sp. 1 TL-2023]
MASYTTTETAICFSCDKSLQTPIRRCARCQSVRYCSPDCQRQHWRSHKLFCQKAGSSDAADNAVLERTLHKLQRCSGVLDWLGKEECCVELIDSYRLRAQEDHKLDGESHGIHSGEDPREDFAHFLDLAEQRVGLMPGWWSKSTRPDCETTAGDKAGRDWIDLFTPIEERDVIAHYNDLSKVLSLRELADKIYGRPVSGRH